MLRVLFVDDDPHVLGGLRNLLRRERERWEMVFVQSGQAALDEMAKAPFDVVISDMGMPGMDGVELLEAVKQRWPSTSRLVLSGIADSRAILRLLPVAQQYIGKPCDANSVRAAIDQTRGSLANLLSDELRTFVGRLDSLPSPPTTYFELTRALADPATNAKDLAEIVQRDPGMSAKVLQLVNSAYFGLPRRFVAIAEALPYLGTTLMKDLALTAEVFGEVAARAPGAFSVQEVQEASFLTARIAKKLCANPSDGEAAFTAGLLHDVGQIVLALGKPQPFEEAAKEAGRSRRPLHVVEKEQLGFTHSEVGACLFAAWGLPVAIVEATAFHHAPAAAGLATFGPLAAVHVADALIEGIKGGRAAEAELLDAELVERTGMTHRLEPWRETVRSELASVGKAVG